MARSGARTAYYGYDNTENMTSYATASGAYKVAYKI